VCPARESTGALVALSAQYLHMATKTTHGRQDASQPLARYSAMNESILFDSRCPKCGHQRVQDGYTRRILQRLINTGSTIEAYCVACDVFWPLGDKERDEIAGGL
jgi:hypothetical protein